MNDIFSAIIHFPLPLTCNNLKITKIIFIEKTLWELIEPIYHRCENVREFVHDISDGIEFRSVPICGAFGPTIEIPDLHCIVVSQETIRDGEAINREREVYYYVKLITKYAKYLGHGTK